MKKLFIDFLRRGSASCGLGPIVLAILYMILYQSKDIATLTVDQICIGIFSLSGLAFVAGGMNVIYQIERLPLMIAILIHGSILYISYLSTYLLNNWLDGGILPILVFSAIFVIGYLAIWIIIYFIIKRNTTRLNETLNKNRISIQAAKNNNM